MLCVFLALIRRDMAVVLRNGQLSSTLSFFIMVVVFFPLAIDPASLDLAAISPAIIWIGLFLAAQLPLERLLHDDYQDGSLALWSLTRAPLEVIATAKYAVAWLTASLPMIFAALASGMLVYQWPMDAILNNMLTILVGSLLLTLISLLTRCLTLGSRGGKGLIYLMSMPLSLPTLIFGAASLRTHTPTDLNTSIDTETTTALILLSLLLLATLIPMLWASTLALRNAISHQ
ncbi:MAG: heme exporter protein CcmB [Alphaproteobacteria bacterium GM202ARS2]|nr:heme exporter protein CcmB [Alphaproteobacteria bacterium GM202ARS2]